MDHDKINSETVILFHHVTDYKRTAYSDAIPHHFHARVATINDDGDLLWKSHDHYDRDSDFYDNLMLECGVQKFSFSSTIYLSDPELVYDEPLTVGRQRANQMAKTLNRIWKQINRTQNETGLEDFAALTSALKKATKATKILTPRKGRENNSRLHLPDYGEITIGRIREVIEMALESEKEQEAMEIEK
jgi:hypothetical protein